MHGVLWAGNDAVVELPVFDRAVGNFQKCRGNGAEAFPVSIADSVGKHFEFGGGLEASEAIFEVFRDTESSAIPCGELAKQCAGTFVMLLRHEFEVLPEEIHLFVG